VIEASADGFRQLAGLTDGECAAVRGLLGGHPVFRLYFEAGLDAARAGERNRSVMIGRAGAGAVLAIEFDDVTVRTVIGRLADDELAAVCATDRRTELHVAEPLRPAVIELCVGRVLADQSIRYYARPVGDEPPPDPRCRHLAAADYETAAALFRAHHPSTIFSRWMLEDTLVGLVEGGSLVACGGVVTRHAGLSTVNLGNFLTIPEHRGRGLAKVVMAAVLASLAADGIRLATLGATAENRAACRSYEAMGFELIDQRAELVVGPG
jgi:ribosomal protein S18 acetylase RimI-like enzyme